MKNTMKQLIIICTLVMIQGLLGARISTSQSSQCIDADLQKAVDEIYAAIGINVTLINSLSESYGWCEGSVSEEQIQANLESKGLGELNNRLTNALGSAEGCVLSKYKNHSCAEVVKCSQDGETILYDDDKYTSNDINDFLLQYGQVLKELCN